MKIIFVNALVQTYEESFSIGLSILSTILKKEGYEVEIVDFIQLADVGVIDSLILKEARISSLGKVILDKKADIISFYTLANSYHISILLAEYIKSQNKNQKIIFGGPQATVSANVTLEAFPFIDYIGLGEGENTIVKIMKAIGENADLRDVPGIAFRYKDKIIENKNDELISNLDDLPYIDYSLVPNIKKIKRFPLEVGRGCPFSCKYCSTKTFWKQNFRLKSNQRIIDEIKYLVKNYDIHEFNFVHDHFTVNKNRIIQFCDELVKENLNITWSCSSRVDNLDEETMISLRGAGCETILVGIETGSQRMQKAINKNLKLEAVLPKIKLLKQYNFNVITSFMYGFPDETYEDIAETMKLARELLKLKVDNVQFHTLSILRGTEFYSEYKDKLIPLEKDLYSNFIEGGSAEQFEHLYKAYPNIFPHVYMVNDILYKIKYMDKFFNYHYKMLVNQFQNTFNLLMKFYDENLFLMYYDLLEELGKTNIDMIKYGNGEISKQQIYINLLNSIKAYIDNKAFGDYNEKIKLIFGYEYELNKFANSDLESATHTFMFDVVKYIKKPLVDEPISPKQVNIRFVKNNNRVKIQEVDSNGEKDKVS